MGEFEAWPIELWDGMFSYLVLFDGSISNFVAQEIVKPFVVGLITEIRVEPLNEHCVLVNGVYKAYERSTMPGCGVFAKFDNNGSLVIKDRSESGDTAYLSAFTRKEV